MELKRLEEQKQLEEEMNSKNAKQKPGAPKDNIVKKKKQFRVDVAGDEPLLVENDTAVDMNAEYIA